MRIHAAVVLFAAAAFAGTAGAQVYKWTDENGQVHYSDRAPPNATQIKGPTPPTTAAPPAASAPATGSDAAPPEAVSTPAPDSPAARQVRADVAKAREEQCKRATEAYNQSVRARRVYREGENGERTFLSDAEADAMRLQLRAEMDTACSGR